MSDLCVVKTCEAIRSAFLSLMPVYQLTARDVVTRAIGDMATALFSDAAQRLL